MEEKINIAEILKDKQQGTKLYSILSDGECFLNEVSEDSIYIDIDNRKRFWCFTVYGSTHSFPNGCVLLFPSREMRDWHKFAWKKGDVLAGAFGALCIFEKWANDDYTRFDAKFVIPKSRGTTFEVEDWCKVTNEACIRQYIRDIEEDNGGKLNLTTLEIENNQPEFKDGDIVMSDSGTIVLVRGISLTRKIYYHAYMRNEYIYINQVKGEFFSRISRIKRFATDSEKQQLFAALEKEGKRWDAEKKQIVDLKPKIELKPFDKVLSRRCSEDYWVLNFYSHKSHKTDYHICIDGSSNLYCIPYNEETAHLLGTTDDWEGGEV